MPVTKARPGPPSGSPNLKLNRQLEKEFGGGSHSELRSTAITFLSGHGTAVTRDVTSGRNNVPTGAGPRQEARGSRAPEVGSRARGGALDSERGSRAGDNLKWEEREGGGEGGKGKLDLKWMESESEEEGS
eukprot:1188088-Rhodomonas_salina.1